MGYVEGAKRKVYLVAGFMGMLLCGVGDILLSFRGKSNPDILSGMVSMSIKEVPLWYYMLSFFIGIAATVAYFSASRAAYSVILDRLDGKPSRLLKIYTFGANMMSIGVFGIHSICCMAVMSIRAAAEAGVSADMIDRYFTVPMLIPFAVAALWQTAADIIVAVAFIGLILTKTLNISKGWIVCGPICLYVIFGIIKAVLSGMSFAMADNLLAGGETWGLAMMFMAVLVCAVKNEKTKAE